MIQLFFFVLSFDKNSLSFIYYLANNVGNLSTPSSISPNIIGMDRTDTFLLKYLLGYIKELYL